jgi:hypothetical protein
MVPRMPVRLALVLSASLLAGCASKPARTPRILGSYPPPGAGQPPPLQSAQPIQVPAAPIGGAALQAVPAVQVAPAATLAVPVQPGAATVPVQPGAIAVPATNGGGTQRSGSERQYPAVTNPATPTQERQNSAPAESGTLDPLPPTPPNR